MKNYVSVSLVGKKFERMFSAAEAVSCDHFGSDHSDYINWIILLTSDFYLAAFGKWDLEIWSH